MKFWNAVPADSSSYQKAKDAGFSDDEMKMFSP